MVLDRNTSPYYDDYDEDKKFYQILFRPGIPVQARELSQLQTILQKQVDRFGRHVFKEGSMVIPGEIAVDLQLPYIKLEDQFASTDIDVDDFDTKRIIGTTSGAVATVIEVAASENTDPNTLFLKIETGDSALAFTGSITNGSASVTSVSISATSKLVVGAIVTGTGIPANTYIEEIVSATEITLSNAATATNASASLTATTSDSFTDGETIITEDGNSSATITSDSNGNTGYGSRFLVNQGVYFVNGFFCLITTQSLILEKYSNTPSYRVGFRYIDEFISDADDVTLVDPATGAPNFNAPGAHRYKIDLVVDKYDLEEELPDNFVELVRVDAGSIQRLVNVPQYEELEKTLARRTFDESGDYIVRNFPLQIREHLDDGSNFGVYTSSNGGDNTKLIAAVEPGKAYIRGFETELSATKLLEVNKARDTDTVNNSIIPFTMGSYVDVQNLKGTFDITSYDSVELLSLDKGDSNYPGIVLGTARVRGLEFVSGTPGDSAAKYRLYLFDIEMNTDSNGVKYLFGNVKAIATASQAEDCDCIQVASETILYDMPNNVALLRLPNSAIKTLENALDTTYTVKRYVTGTMTGDSLTITCSSNEIFSSWSASNYHVSVISASATAIGNGVGNGDVIDISAAGNSIALSGSPVGRQAVVTIPDIADSEIAIIATVTKSLQGPKTKTLTSRTQTVAFANTVALDRADIYRIVSITNLDSNLDDITDRFTLDNGQRDNYYDLGSVSFSQDYPAPSGNIEIEYEYFEHGSGDYFSVDSYDGVIDYEDIPTYVSPTTGASYDLISTIDFRPRVNNTGTGFSVTSEFVATGTNFRCDYEYYIPRIDKVFLDQSGTFRIVEGVSSEFPIAPKSPENGIVLYELLIPAYTHVASDVIIRKINNKRYTMKDIGKLEQRIQNLEYYSSLSLLEKETADLFIDDGTGANRFKNGFLVDNFTSHLVGDVGLQEYACSIDSQFQLLRPAFVSTSVPMDLSTSDSSNYQKTGDLLTLPYTTEVLISQPFASKTENINPYNVFNWTGTIILTPETDEWYETEQAPDRIIVNDDGLADSLAALNGQVIWNDWQTDWIGTPILTQTVSTRHVGVERRSWGLRDTFEVTQLVTSEQGQSRTGTRLTIEETTNTQSLGDRVINTDVIPWIREKEVLFDATALKPNTRVYPFFDNVNVSAYVTPTGGSLGGALVTDNNGSVSGTFDIPNTDSLKFRTGERVFKLCDSDTDDANFITTSAQALYTARGLLETKQETILSTRSAQVVTTTVTDSRVTIGSSLRTVTQQSGWYDPLAQTFLIDSEGGVFLSKIDLYFATKDTGGVPIILQIRNVVNGYPGQLIVPFSTVTLNPDDINTSATAATVTSFTFESPVYLLDGQEYCFVLLSNSNEYTIWCSRIGEFDVATGERISQQPYAGVMFKSQNASTWTADQEQDIKFKIHKCVFNTAVTATTVFKNAEIDTVRLPTDPFYMTGDSNNTVLVYHPNHGLSDGHTTTITGVAATVNGVPASELNTTHTVEYVDFDHYNITVATAATLVGAGGGSAVYATRNIRSDVVNALFETINLPETSMSWGIKIADDTATLPSSYIPIEVKSNNEFYSESFIYSTENEDSGKTAVIRSQFSSTNANVSPVVDTQRASIIAVSNRVNNDSTDELTARSGNALSRYITKKVILDNPATGVRVYFSALRPPLATIKVYIKYQADDESNIFDDLVYVELDQVDYPVGSEVSFSDYVFELDSLEPFSIYAIKIVMLSEETSDVPLIRDFRTIALA